MKSSIRPLRCILLAVLVVLSAATHSHAEKRIGVIMTGDVPYYGAMHDTFVSELSKKFAGVEEIEIILQKPFPNSISWSNAARKLIAFDVDLIVTYGSSATQAVLHEKSRIPLVYAGLYEPDQADVAGKNVTGCGFKVPMSSVLRYFKRLKHVDTLGIIFSSVEDDSVRQFEEMKLLALQQNIKTEKIDVRSRTDLDHLTAMDIDAAFIAGSALTHMWIDDILTILRRKEIPAADIFPDDQEAGVLMALYQPPHTQGQMASQMASQILLGENAANIPPQTFRDTELVFNLEEARRLGIDFPIQLLIEATRVVQ